MKDVTSKNEYYLPLFPGLLPYPHTVGAPAFKPTKEGVIRSKSQTAMSEQVQVQKDQILEQVKLLQKQYSELVERETISNLIYRAEIKFKPVPGHTYHLYLRDTGYFLSLIEPNQWGRTFKAQFVASIKLLYDLTWQVLDKSEQFNNFTNENLS
jgi:hypothetical protein